MFQREYKVLWKFIKCNLGGEVRKVTMKLTPDGEKGVRERGSAR